MGRAGAAPRAPRSRAGGALPIGGSAKRPAPGPPAAAQSPPCSPTPKAGEKRGLSPWILVASGLHGPGAQLGSRSWLGKDGKRRPPFQSVVQCTRAYAGQEGLEDGPSPVQALGGCGVGSEGFWRVNTCLARETGTRTQKLTRAAPLPQEPLHSPGLPFCD